MEDLLAISSFQNIFPEIFMNFPFELSAENWEVCLDYCVENITFTLSETNRESPKNIERGLLRQHWKVPKFQC
jgi:hypothetical protein